MKPKLKKKRWKAQQERDIINYWKKNETFKFDQDDKRPVFIIDTPPPYVSGRAHLGFAVHYAQIDMIARFNRMQGKNVLFPACTDRNGLPVEVKVEQKLNKSMHEIPREEFLGICKKELDKAEKNTLTVMEWMGLSCNKFYGSPEIFYQTDSNKYRFNTQKTFVELWYKGEIYSDKRPNNWCIDCGTTIADAEIEYKDDTTELYSIKFGIADSQEEIVIATTRPELIPTCEMIIFHPNDKRYSNIEGKLALTPLFDKKVPIISHRDADPDFGTGILMICAYGDKADVKIIREKGISNPKTIIKADGTLNENAGKFKGLKIIEARQLIIKDLETNKLLVTKEQVQRRVPICWRSMTPIEIIAMDEFYLKQTNHIPKLKKLALEMDFFPKYHKSILDNWINSVNIDWAISRRRFYGTSIPIWYCKNCNKPNVPSENELNRYYEAWKEKSPQKFCKFCKQSLNESIGEDRTFDTWFDSSISELAACNYNQIFFEDDGAFFDNNFPCSIRTQGKEIIRTWLYYTLLRSYHLFNSPPFRKVWISGLILDPYGGKMSKSLGNSVDPLIFLQPAILPKNTPEELIPERDSWKTITGNNYAIKNLYLGADSVRLTSCLQGSHGSDIRFSLLKLEGNSKFITKLWNIARFISSFEFPDKPETLFSTDKWILESLDRLNNRSIQGYKQLTFSIPAENLYNWIWNIFAPHYLEMVKTRAYSTESASHNDKISSLFTLHQVLITILKLLAPICPFITEAIYQEIYNPDESIHNTLMNKPFSKETLEQEITSKIINLNSFIWKSKRENDLSLKDPITTIYLPESLLTFSKDLLTMHSAQKILVRSTTLNDKQLLISDEFALKI